MRSLKQQLMLLVIGPLLLLSIVGSVMTGFFMKDRAVLATDTKATSDLATGETIIDLMYPGPWQVRDGILYKGDVRINNNFEPVDKIAALTGDTVTIFLSDTRVSTTVREKSGERAIGTKASDAVAQKVIKDGQQYLGQAPVVGELYQTAYKPLRDPSGKIVGMFYVGISKKFSDHMIYNSLLMIGVVSVILTALVALVAWFFTQKAIIGPLKQITLGTQQVATGNRVKKIHVDANNEIGELAAAFNQMMDGMQGFAMHIAKVAGAEKLDEIPVITGTKQTMPEVAEENKVLKESNSPIENRVSIQNNILAENNASNENSASNETNVMVEQLAEELPKGLNESTLRQILSYLKNVKTPMSAEEIGEGVNLTRVTARRYLEYLEKIGRVEMELKYGTVGRPVKLYRNIEQGAL